MVHSLSKKLSSNKPGSATPAVHDALLIYTDENLLPHRTSMTVDPCIPGGNMVMIKLLDELSTT